MPNEIEQKLLNKYFLFRKDPPRRVDFGLENGKIVSFSQLSVMNKLIDQGTTVEINAMELIKKENSYRNVLKQYNEYQEWKRNRNPKRAELERQFKMDTKHACHLVRLLRQGYEIMSVGKVIVNRSDAKDFIAILNGEWSYERIVSYAVEMDGKMAELYSHPEKCAVPYSPNIGKLDELCVSIIDGYWRKNDR